MFLLEHPEKILVKSIEESSTSKALAETKKLITVLGVMEEGSTALSGENGEAVLAEMEEEVSVLELPKV